MLGLWCLDFSWLDFVCSGELWRAKQHAMLSGFAVGLSLIVAIGAQNAFVLKQGLKQRYVFWICLVCALSDSLLILLGVAGFAEVVERYPNLVHMSKLFGAVFLLTYGARHFYSAYKIQQSLLPTEHAPESFVQIILLCLAFTWLNPHVYLDTVILVGSISTQYSDHQWWFAFGAVCSSWLFFFSLGYGAKLLLPWFQKPISWKILDVLIGLMMWGIALSLIYSA